MTGSGHLSDLCREARAEALNGLTQHFCQDSSESGVQRVDAFEVLVDGNRGNTCSFCDLFLSEFQRVLFRKKKIVSCFALSQVDSGKGSFLRHA